MGLREARKAAGMSLRDLAQKVGVTAASINRYELGQRSPKIPIAKRIAEVLGVNWYDLVDNRESA